MALPMEQLEQEKGPKQSAQDLFQTLWRLHFYAGLIFAPFFVILAVSGSLYLFKPQIESWLYKNYYYVQPATQKLAPSEQLKSVSKKYPEADVTSFTPHTEANRTSEFGIMSQGKTATAYVNPYDGAVLGTINDKDRLFEQLKAIHNGELWGGTFGNRLIELAACWAFILILTGLYLWWPRNRTSWWGTILPRWKNGKRTFWRDLHAVPAFWLSAFLLVLIFTGLTWSGVWGDMVNKAATATKTGYPDFAFAFGPKPESDVPKTKDVAKDVPWAAENMPVPKSAGQTAQPLSLEKVAEIAQSKNVSSGYTLYLPEGKKGVYTVSTNPQRPENQATLHIDQYSGKVLADRRFDDYGSVAKAISIGIALHEGRYFGWVNQILGALVCIGLIGLAATGVNLWWKRRPSGKLGAPPPVKDPKKMMGVTIILLALGIVFPLVGISLVLVFLLDRFVIQRILVVKQWVG